MEERLPLANRLLGEIEDDDPAEGEEGGVVMIARLLVLLQRPFQVSREWAGPATETGRRLVENPNPGRIRSC